MREFGFKAKQMGKTPCKGVWEHVPCKKWERVLSRQPGNPLCNSNMP